MLMSVISIPIAVTVMRPASIPGEVLHVHAMMDTLAMEHFVKVSLFEIMQRQND